MSHTLWLIIFTFDNETFDQNGFGLMVANEFRDRLKIRGHSLLKRVTRNGAIPVGVQQDGHQLTNMRQNAFHGCQGRRCRRRRIARRRRIRIGRLHDEDAKTPFSLSNADVATWKLTAQLKRALKVSQPFLWYNFILL